MTESFSQRVWELATSIPPGRVTTYGILAAAAGGGPMAARSITHILSKAPNQAAIPFHRIVYSDGRIWLPEACAATRRTLYRREGIMLTSTDKIAELADVMYYFDEH